MSKGVTVPELKSIAADLQDEISAAMKKQNIPGIALGLVTKNGYTCTCFGHTNTSRTHKIDTNTLFSLQSTTKTVTAVAFLLAAQKGLVSLDDCVHEYYPDFMVYSVHGDDQYKKITFRHLLSHASGLTRESTVGGVFNYVPCTFEEHIAGISGSWLKFPVGKGFSYSNAGMDLVTYVIECITGIKYPEYVQKVLGDPLGITFCYDTKTVYNTENTARGYLGKKEAHPVDPVGLGCGAAHLSIADQAVFVKFLLNKGYVDGTPVLNPKYIDEMYSVDKEGWYGLGSFVNSQYGTTVVYHPGGGFGYLSEMYWLPEYGTGVCVFSNQEFCEPENYMRGLAKKALEYILKVQGVSTKGADVPLNQPKHVDHKLLPRFTGLYTGVWDVTSVFVKNKKLYLQYGKEIELTPYSETAFGAESLKVTFQLDNEVPVSLKLYSKNSIYHMDYRGTPPEGEGPHKIEWDQFTGIYQMRIYGSIPSFCGVTIKDGFLHAKWWSDTCLYQHEIPNIFFAFLGDAVIFEDGYLLYDNVKFDKITDIGAVVNELKERGWFQKWVQDAIVDRLKYIGKDDEAEKVLNFQ
jgi:CubicO group peptidase (beta-lactamase class C family)